ncbi:MAG: trypsin-like serine peptidase [Rhodospirillaceae bacterium]
MVNAVGIDNTTYPNSAVVYIEARWDEVPGNYAFGSGTVVGDNDVLTASHVIYDSTYGLADSIRVYYHLTDLFDADGNRTDKYWEAAHVSYYPSSSWDSDSDGLLYSWDVQYDIAVLGFRQDIDDTTGKMGLMPSTYLDWRMPNTQVSGFPDIYHDGDNPRQTWESNTAYWDYFNSVDIWDFDLNAGNSGGPVYGSFDAGAWGPAGTYLFGIVNTGLSGAAYRGRVANDIDDWITDNDFLLASSLANFDPSNSVSDRESGGFSLLKYQNNSWKLYDPETNTETDFTADSIRFGDYEYQMTYDGMLANGFDVNQLKDFDGNGFGEADNWSLLGIGDVDGDDTQQYILANSALGRWATVDGDMDEGDHGAGGDTRVVGIYLDPYVESGEVTLGSDFDSQTRFTNDLKNNNLYVLGNIDGDLDGFQDVFFKTSDGTAYLRALMHADGNIQYANYMVWDQLEAWMQSNGVDSAFYDDWQTV